MAVAFDLIAEVGGPAVLPDDRVMNGAAGLAVPDDGCFALVGDADCLDVCCGELGVAQHGLHDIALALPDFIGIVFDPAGFGEILAEFSLSDAQHLPVATEKNRSATGGSLIESEDTGHKHLRGNSLGKTFGRARRALIIWTDCNEGLG